MQVARAWLIATEPTFAAGRATGRRLDSQLGAMQGRRVMFPRIAAFYAALHASRRRRRRRFVRISFIASLICLMAAASYACALPTFASGRMRRDLIAYSIK